MATPNCVWLLTKRSTQPAFATAKTSMPPAVLGNVTINGKAAEDSKLTRWNDDVIGVRLGDLKAKGFDGNRDRFPTGGGLRQPAKPVASSRGVQDRTPTRHRLLKQKLQAEI